MSEAPKDDNQENFDPLSGFEEISGPAAFKKPTEMSEEQEASLPDDLQDHFDEDLIDMDQMVPLADLEALTQRLAETQDKLLRAVAETENIRNRARRDREDASKFSIAKFARDLLEVSDNFSRALETLPEDKDELDDRMKGLIEGIEATSRSMDRTYEKNGIVKLNPMDEKFDPNFHEVMFEAPIPDKPPGTIFQVMEIGYTINGRLLRPARVGVTKACDGAPTKPIIDEEV